ncbi:hypothetical protein [Saccharicrinis fermentans]|uniref:YD repeat-containing protein n=1 Tax=Saccharicrinis fermentans DSM 9555 = JCM 21142 TaxID=869213 RepID=W7Y4S0_9BACT|nr:hypothetical protein [Saccharicrinis fermentans]GAF05925.1 hypothetical protein JCM21142_124687 [Saccharicrinis fermentans DSM 9555 = JCM 21142]
MKHIVPILVIIILLSSCKSIQLTSRYFDQENDYDRELLLGKVKTYTTYKTDKTDDSSIDDRMDKKVINKEFNNKGFITRYESFNDDGSLDIRIVKTYTNDTILRKEVRTVGNNNQVQITYSLDSIKEDDEIVGWIKKQYSVINKGGYNTEHIKVLDKNNRVKKSIFIQQGDTMKTTLFSMDYDENDKLIKISNTEVGGYADGNTSEIHYKYDKKGNLQEITSIPALSFSKVIYQYDKKNRVNRMTNYGIKTSYGGLMVVNSSEPQESIITETYYDSFYNPTRVITYAKDRSLIKAERIKYKYDGTGNWILKKVYVKDMDHRKWNYSYQLARNISYYL